MHDDYEIIEEMINLIESAEKIKEDFDMYCDFMKESFLATSTLN